ncbi:MAG: GGIII-like transmembrane region-containing protein [Candidatus Heimdallarchaeota archaeon]
MNRNLKRFTITFGIVLLVSTNICSMLFTEGFTEPDFNNELIKAASENFTEDFTTTTFSDVTSTAFGWGSGTITNDRELAISPLGFMASENPIRAIDVQGKKAYAVQNNPSSPSYSLNIYDLSDPSDISRTGYRDSMSHQMAIAVEGDVVYAGRGSQYPIITSYYYIDPFTAGTHLMNTQCDGSITDIETNGYLVYYTVYNSSSGYSLRVLNAEDPAIHNNITASWMSSYALGLAVDGNLVYVAASEEGFYVVNVTDQNSFVEVGYVNTPGNATDVIVDGTLAYLADGPAGVHVMDISNPANPTILGTFDTAGYARKLVLQGKTLFVADGDNGVVVLDVADSYHPTPVPSPAITPFVWDVDLYGGVLVVSTDDGLHTFSVGPGITNIANTAFQNPFDGFEAWDVRVQGDVAIVAAGPDGLYTLDVSDPNNPILLDQDVQGATPFYRKLDVQGNFAYIADYGVGKGLRIYDISDPTDITQVEFEGLTYATDVAVYGDIVFIADGEYGVYFFNISDTSNAIFQGSFDAFDNVTALWVQGPQLYVVESLPGAPVVASLYIYNIADIDNEVQIGFNVVDAMFYDIFVDGDVVYTSDSDWMILYNVTNPTTPLWSTWTLNQSFGVWGFGPYCLSAGLIDGVSLVDSTDPFVFDPVISAYTDATGAIQITTHGDYTYVANTSSLVILRHFESLADTYVTGTTFAQSLEIDSLTFGIVKSATLTAIDFVPPGTQANYFMSADGGVNWEAVTPGVLHEFANKGLDLRWQVTITGPTTSSVHIYEISINFETSIFSPTMIYILAGAGGGLLLIIILVIVFVSIRKKKKTPTR